MKKNRILMAVLAVVLCVICLAFCRTEAKAINEIEEWADVDQMPTKLHYEEGDTLDLTGGTIIVHYEGGGYDIVDMTECTCSVTELTQYDMQIITLYYHGFEITFDVFVDHKFVDVYDWDEWSHWLVCSYCEEGVLMPEEDHVYSNLCDTSCDVCGATRTVKHSYDNDCDTTCNLCPATRTITHKYADATCTAPKTCKVCGVTTGKKLGHKYDNDCDTKCNRCGAKRTIEHDYAPATCTKPKTCRVCGATSGDSLGHKYSNDCDKTCNRCDATRKNITHTYKNAADSSCEHCDYTRKVKYDYTIEVGETLPLACQSRWSSCSITVSDSKLASVTNRGLGFVMTNFGSYYVHSADIVAKKAGGLVVTFDNGWGSEEVLVCIKEGIKSAKLSATSYIYDGKVKTPKVTIKNTSGKTLKEGTDYTVTYASGRKNVGTYKVTVKFKGNYSGTKTLTFKINPKAAISTQPKTQKVKVGEKIKFTVKATGAGLKYQWQYSTNGKTWKNCSASAAKKASFSFTSKTSHDGNYYRCKVTDSAGNVVYTKAVRAYVLGIEKQPVKKTVTKNKTAKFTVDASGNGLKYQWQYSTNGGKTWKTCSGSAAKKAAYSFKSKISQNGYYFRCKITDSAKNVIYTSKVKLTVKK